MVPVGCGQVRKPAQLPVLTMITGMSGGYPPAATMTGRQPD
jgi:hypothetical protein